MARWRQNLQVASGFLTVVILLAACQENPGVQKERYFRSGQRYLAEHKYDEAIIEFRNAVQIDPRFADAHVALGQAYQGKRWIHDARWEYTKALEIDPQHLEGHVHLAGLYRELGLTDDAIQTARKALEIDNKNATASIVLGRALSQIRKFAEAKQAIDLGLTLAPQASEGYLALGEWHFRAAHIPGSISVGSAAEAAEKLKADGITIW